MHYWSAKAAPLGYIPSSESHVRLAFPGVTVKAEFSATVPSVSQRVAIWPLVSRLQGSGAQPILLPLYLNPGSGRYPAWQKGEDQELPLEGATECLVKEDLTKGSPGAHGSFILSAPGACLLSFDCPPPGPSQHPPPLRAILNRKCPFF